MRKDEWDGAWVLEHSEPTGGYADGYSRLRRFVGILRGKP